MRDDNESGPGGLRLPPDQVRQKRIELASEMLALSLREAAGWPVAEQQKLRTAMRCLADVRQWCKHHPEAR
jgi:hypothetical protein